MARRDLTQDSAAVVRSRNLIPSFYQARNLLLAGEGGNVVDAYIDMDEPITIQPGETKRVAFRYRTGIPAATAFSLAYFASEEDAEFARNPLQDVLLPTFTITPPYPRADTGGLQEGEVKLVAPIEMQFVTIYVALTIWQPGGTPGSVIVQP